MVSLISHCWFLIIEEPNIPGRWTYFVCAVARGEFFGEHISFVSSSTNFCMKIPLVNKKKTYIKYRQVKRTQHINT